MPIDGDKPNFHPANEWRETPPRRSGNPRCEMPKARSDDSRRGLPPINDGTVTRVSGFPPPLLHPPLVLPDSDDRLRSTSVAIIDVREGFTATAIGA